VLGIETTQRIGAGSRWSMAGCLDGPEITTITKCREDIALIGSRELQTGAGWRADVAREAGPESPVLKSIEQVALTHASLDFHLEARLALGSDVALSCLRCGTSSASIVSSALEG
jgi:hypothetical protein